LQVASQDAKETGTANISFHEADAYNLDLPPESFDLVYSRFLMCHVSEPLRALLEMRSLLKPGGVLVCEDHDDGGFFTEPPTDAYRRLREMSEAVNRARGLDSYIGLKLPQFFSDAGFPRPAARVNPKCGHQSRCLQAGGTGCILPGIESQTRTTLSEFGVARFLPKSVGHGGPAPDSGSHQRHMAYNCLETRAIVNTMYGMLLAGFMGGVGSSCQVDQVSGVRIAAANNSRRVLFFSEKQFLASRA
jgi:Methyltransferase domain